MPMYLGNDKIIPVVPTDTSDATATAGDIAEGTTAYIASGKAVGTAEVVRQSTADKVTEIDGKIGTTTDTGGSTTAGTVMGKLNKALSDMGGKSIIKSITRIEKMNIVKGGTTTIALPNVNPDKTILNILAIGEGGPYYNYQITSTALHIIDSGNYAQSSICADVVEFA